ncbi:hypothetical protein VCR4J2_580203 [Vibrio coralliirubri]|nr:hypothetical protein VCR4J2_580203 [Vibrio coralliirubri]
MPDGVRKLPCRFIAIVSHQVARQKVANKDPVYTRRVEWSTFGKWQFQTTTQ